MARDEKVNKYTKGGEKYLEDLRGEVDSLAARNRCVRFPFGSPLHKENRIKPVYKM